MSSSPEANRALVLDAMTSLFQHRDPLAVDRLYTADYIQHNPHIPQGREALSKLVAQLPPGLFYEPGMVIAQGAYVAIHGRIRGWAPNPQVVVDIFRVEDGRLAEHWDVLQDEVPTPDSKAGTSMFSPDERDTQDGFNRAAIATQDATTDYDRVLQANLTRVFGEHDASKRLVAIRELYTEDATFHEPHASFTGHDAINGAVTALLASLPSGFAFAPLGSATGHHGLGRLRWESRKPGQPAGMTGTDVAYVREGRIQILFVFLDIHDA